MEQQIIILYYFFYYIMSYTIVIIVIAIIIAIASFNTPPKVEHFSNGGKKCGDKDRCLPEDAKLDAWCGTKFEKEYLTPEEQAKCPK